MQITTYNTNTAEEVVYNLAAKLSLKEEAISSSRNGKVISFNEPVTITYEHPWHRVNFSVVRDANPFFHLLEAYWMLAGRNDLGFFSDILPSMSAYSDNGISFYGAYGRRLMTPVNQLASCGGMLRRDPDTRRAVASLWDPEDILAAEQTKDLPCNLMLCFRILKGKLETTIFNRSNDAVWGGVTGSNIVHFSMFHELVAGLAGVHMGKMHMISNNLHVYVNPQSTELLKHYGSYKPKTDMYTQGAKDFPMYEPGRSGTVQWEAEKFCNGHMTDNPFIESVVRPMKEGYSMWNHGDKESAVAHLANKMPDKCDWKIASMNWMQRRMK